MKQKLLYLFTRTPLHVGAGTSVGAIDQPIIRERHTGFPVIPGTSLKGVLRDTATRDDKIEPDVDAIFGEGFGSGSKDFSAGRVSFGEAKLLVQRAAAGQSATRWPWNASRANVATWARSRFPPNPRTWNAWRATQ